MDNVDLTICIPARNEEWLSLTVEGLLKTIRGNTEIIAVLDGQWSDPPIAQNERVSVIYVPESIGQREATNLAVRLSKGKYVLKIDAHCKTEDGFDVKMLDAFKETGDNTVMAPAMYNLWMFDWKCMKCGHRRYQSPTPTSCPDCDNTTNFKKKVTFTIDAPKGSTARAQWKGPHSPRNRAYCFDNTPHFQYHDAQKAKAGDQELIETMSLQGSCFMLTKEKYWQLGLGDASFPSWGSQGIQIACSFWLSGGKVIVNNRTWYAHLFRTQGGDFGFPYPNPHSKAVEAKMLARKLLFENNWPNQIHPSSWLIEKFKPVPGWHDPSGAEDLRKINESGEKFLSDSSKKVL